MHFRIQRSTKEDGLGQPFVSPVSLLLSSPSWASPFTQVNCWRRQIPERHTVFSQYISGLQNVHTYLTNSQGWTKRCVCFPGLCPGAKCSGDECPSVSTHFDLSVLKKHRKLSSNSLPYGVLKDLGWIYVIISTSDYGSVLLLLGNISSL